MTEDPSDPAQLTIARIDFNSQLLFVITRGIYDLGLSRAYIRAVLRRLAGTIVRREATGTRTVAGRRDDPEHLILEVIEAARQRGWDDLADRAALLAVDWRLRDQAEHGTDDI